MMPRDEYSYHRSCGQYRQGHDSPPAGGRAGSLELVRKYRINIACRPELVDTLPGAKAIGYSPLRHFGTFLQDLQRLDRELGPQAVANMKCMY